MEIFKGLSLEDITVSSEKRGNVDSLTVNITHGNGAETLFSVQPDKPLYPGLSLLNRRVLTEVTGKLQAYAEKPDLQAEQKRLVNQAVSGLREIGNPKGPGKP